MAESKEISTNFMKLAFVNKNDYQVERYTIEFISKTISYEFTSIYYPSKKFIET